ncbi:NYN domain-containing protein [Pseudotabrizicola algicola]|nr:hypothetical protein [Pseudotabrizicola algicola]
MTNLLFLMSLAVALFGYGATGSARSEPVALALAATLLALALMLRRPPVPRRPRRVERRGAILVDGSNIMHWKNDEPRLDTLKEVLRALREQGYEPGVVFDANAGYKLAGRYMDDGPLARALGLSEDQVLVVPKGEQADPFILRTARDLGIGVLSNDRFRDWAGDFPEVAQPGHVRRGGYRDGVLWLETAG